jgi:PAP2 superfamily protein
LSAFMPAERAMLGVTLALGLVDLILIVARGAALDWPAYAIIVAISAVVLGLGLFYRRTQRSEALAATLIATASFLLFTLVASVSNYLLLPVWRSPIDPLLAQLDAGLGFHWPDLLTYAAGHPLAVEVMRFAYLSSLPQFALIVVVLGLSGRTADLYVFMLATTLACLATVAIWALFPSFGTTTLFHLDAAVERAVRPVVGSAYGAELKRLAAYGPAVISPKNALGLIAAPSFHTVMAILAAYATLGVRWLSPAAILLNVMVLPGVLVHGGHHLVDMLAGAIVAIAGIAAARALVQASLKPAGLSPAHAGAALPH